MAATFGMARYVYGLTLPDVRAELDLPEPVLGLIASGTFVGFLLALSLSKPLAVWKGARAPTTLGGVCGMLGCAVVAGAPSPSILAAGALIAGSAAGWVWAPFSEIVAAVAPEDDRPRLLAWITTGASGGLLLVGPLALAAESWVSWRATWGGIAVVSAAAVMLNLRWVPRIPPRRPSHGRGVVLTRGLQQPLVFAVALFAAATAYFTYATDAAARNGLGDVAGPVVFLLVGVVGLAGLRTGSMTTRFGSRAVAVGALGGLAASLIVLALGAGWLVAVLLSAVVFGVSNVVGSAALAVWSAQQVPEAPAAAFTATLLVGSLSSIITPALVGALAPHVGLAAVLLAVAALTAITGLVLTVVRGPRRGGERAGC
jgi:predicted MFS family arabinose efflux permease